MGARRRCCCECRWYGDTFNREPSTYLGPCWDEPEGTDAEIVYINDEWVLKITEGIVRYTCAKSSDPEGSVIGSVQPMWPLPGDAYDFIYNWDIENDTFYFVRYTSNAGGVSTLEIWDHSGGTETLLKSSEPPEGATCPDLYYTDPGSELSGFGVCFDRQVSEALGAYPVIVETPTTNGRYMGLRHGGGPRPIYLDNFNFQDHYIFDHRCPSCTCTCDGRLLPDVLTLTVHYPDGLPEACYGQIPEGATMTLQRLANRDWWQPISSGGFACYSYHNPPAGPDYQFFRLECNSGGNYALGYHRRTPAEFAADPCDSNLFVLHTTVIEQQCDPLTFTFQMTSWYNLCCHEPGSDVMPTPAGNYPVQLIITE